MRKFILLTELVLAHYIMLNFLRNLSIREARSSKGTYIFVSTCIPINFRIYASDIENRLKSLFYINYIKNFDFLVLKELYFSKF